jgi:hypothetical protein
VRRRALTTLALIVAAAVAAGCGSDDEKGAPIPADAAAALQTRLDEVERRLAFGRGACADIQEDSKPAVQEILSSLPADVDDDVRAALEDGLDRLFQLSEEQCEDEPEEDPSTETETVETEPEQTTPTETAETETDTTPTETTEVPTDELPPGQDGELPPGQEEGDPGQGNGGGAIVPGGEE